MKASFRDIAIILVLIGAFMRLIPHPPNFTPILAIALFAGTKFKDSRYSFIIPVVAMLISDMVIGFHYGMTLIYSIMILATVIGRYFKGIFSAAIVSSLLFFLISNFQVWLVSGMYQKSIFGLIECYTMAIPFFGMTLLSTLTYTYALFSVFYLLTKTPKYQRV